MFSYWKNEITKCETKMGAHVARLIPDVRTGAELSRESLSATSWRAPRAGAAWQTARPARRVKN
jgi:hypothetical protein